MKRGIYYEVKWYKEKTENRYDCSSNSSNRNGNHYSSSDDDVGNLYFGRDMTRILLQL